MLGLPDRLTREISYRVVSGRATHVSHPGDQTNTFEGLLEGRPSEIGFRRPLDAAMFLYTTRDTTNHPQRTTSCWRDPSRREFLIPKYGDAACDVVPPALNPRAPVARKETERLVEKVTVDNRQYETTIEPERCTPRSL